MKAVEFKWHSIEHLYYIVCIESTTNVTLLGSLVSHSEARNCQSFTLQLV